jgi:hypothetical protein
MSLTGCAIVTFANRHSLKDVRKKGRCRGAGASLGGGFPGFTFLPNNKLPYRHISGNRVRLLNAVQTFGPTSAMKSKS